jgi:hypothetical protein
MKKIISLSLIAISIFLFTACKKDSSNGGGSNYYVKANVGGTDKNYTSNPMAVIINTSGVYSLAIAGGAGGSSLEGLAFQINPNSGPVTAGTYDESSGDYAIAATYNPGTSDVSAIFGAGLNPFSSHPLQIVISNISDKEVSGTFSGEFYDNSGTGTDSLLVTNGEFKVPVQ